MAVTTQTNRKKLLLPTTMSTRAGRHQGARPFARPFGCGGNITSSVGIAQSPAAWALIFV
jgi:hypothetical protein